MIVTEKAPTTTLTNLVIGAFKRVYQRNPDHANPEIAAWVAGWIAGWHSREVASVDASAMGPRHTAKPRPCIRAAWEPSFRNFIVALSADLSPSRRCQPLGARELPVGRAR